MNHEELKINVEDHIEENLQIENTHHSHFENNPFINDHE